MPKLIVSIDGVVIKEVQLTKPRTTLGRRPYNDIVIDNLAVSGEHAAFELMNEEVFLEDLDSTNGTYVNGKVAKQQQLHNGDNVEVGKYKIRFVDEAAGDGFAKTMLFKSGAAAPAPVSTSPPQASAAKAAAASGAPGSLNAVIKVLSGTASGREVPLTKVVTTVGKPGVAVAAITRRHQGFVVAHVEGADNPMLNGSVIGAEPVVLKNGDVIELVGTRMQFVLI